MAKKAMAITVTGHKKGLVRIAEVEGRAGSAMRLGCCYWKTGQVG